MDFSLQIARRVDEVGSQAWDKLSDDRSLASYRWYRFAETVLADDQSFYIILSRCGEPIARAALWLMRREPLPVAFMPVRSVMQALLRRRPLLVCRTPLGAASGLIGPDPPLRDAAVSAIVQTAQDLVQPHHASALLFDYLQRETAEWIGWPTAFHTTALSEPGTCLDITWSDFDSYLRQLPRSMQKDYRRHRNRATDLGVTITADEAPPPAREAMALIRNVERHHHSPPSPWTEAVLRSAALVDSTWLKATIHDRLVGCGLVIGDGDTRFLTMLGLDYGVGYVYFQLVYAAIQCAIEAGVRILRGGTSAYDLKQRLGFRMEDNNYVSYTTNSRLLRWLARHFT